MSNLSNAEIAAIKWNKSNDVAFSELSDSERTKLELDVANGYSEPEAPVAEAPVAEAKKKKSK